MEVAPYNQRKLFQFPFVEQNKAIKPFTILKIIIFNGTHKYCEMICLKTNYAHKFEINLWLLLFRLGPTLSYDIDADVNYVKGGKVAKIHICTSSDIYGGLVESLCCYADVMSKELSVKFDNICVKLCQGKLVYHNSN